MNEQSREKSSMNGRYEDKSNVLKRRDRVIGRIAAEILDLETLEMQNNSRMDFFVNDEVSFSVKDLKEALQTAYGIGCTNIAGDIVANIRQYTQEVI